jgi:hypothetical protein
MPLLIATLIATVLLLIDPADALAWGPATHIELGQRVLGALTPAAGATAALLLRHARDFLYGNIAADVIQAKKFIEAKKHCHNWSTGFRLLDEAGDDRGRAFALGYLCHLAADCVAHNKFVPRQMTVSQSRTEFSHLYWELRADSPIPPPRWAEVRSLVRDHWPDHDELMESQIAMPLLNFRWNKRMFTRVSLASSARSWRRGVRLWERVSRWQLHRDLLGGYHDECLARMQSIIDREADSPALAEDPVGAVSFEGMRVTRKHLRQMARLGILRTEVIDESVAHLAPGDWPGDE